MKHSLQVFLVGFSSFPPVHWLKKSDYSSLYLRMNFATSVLKISRKGLNELMELKQLFKWRMDSTLRELESQWWENIGCIINYRSSTLTSQVTFHPTSQKFIYPTRPPAPTWKSPPYQRLIPTPLNNNFHVITQ